MNTRLSIHESNLNIKTFICNFSIKFKISRFCINFRSHSSLGNKNLISSRFTRRENISFQVTRFWSRLERQLCIATGLFLRSAVVIGFRFRFYSLCAECHSRDCDIEMKPARRTKEWIMWTHELVVHQNIENFQQHVAEKKYRWINSEVNIWREWKQLERRKIMWT